MPTIQTRMAVQHFEPCLNGPRWAASEKCIWSSLRDLGSNPGNSASCYLFTVKWPETPRALGSSKRTDTHMFDNQLTLTDSIHQRRYLGLGLYVNEFL